MNTPIARSLVALIFLAAMLALTTWSLWRARYNPFAARLTIAWWREVYVGALIAALTLLLWSFCNAATILLRALHAVASTKGALL
jgi:hypothetical protein